MKGKQDIKLPKIFKNNKSERSLKDEILKYTCLIETANQIVRNQLWRMINFKLSIGFN